MDSDEHRKSFLQVSRFIITIYSHTSGNIFEISFETPPTLHCTFYIFTSDAFKVFAEFSLECIFQALLVDAKKPPHDVKVKFKKPLFYLLFQYPE